MRMHFNAIYIHFYAMMTLNLKLDNYYSFRNICRVIFFFQAGSYMDISSMFHNRILVQYFLTSLRILVNPFTEPFTLICTNEHDSKSADYD